MAPSKKVIMDVEESFYGEGHPERDRTVMYILVGPWTGHRVRREMKLIVEGVELPPGDMIVTTRRRHEVGPNWKDEPAPAGPPQWATRLTYDPKPCLIPGHVHRMSECQYGPGPSWRGELHGHWEVKLRPVRRRTAWDRLKSRGGPGGPSGASG